MKTVFGTRSHPSGPIAGVPTSRAYSGPGAGIPPTRWRPRIPPGAVNLPDAPTSHKDTTTPVSPHRSHRRQFFAGGIRPDAGAAVRPRVGPPGTDRLERIAARLGSRVRHVITTAFAGVDAMGNTRKDLYVRACLLCIPGRSRMSKAELAHAIAEAEAACAVRGEHPQHTLRRAA
jgi:hypothetical protein